MGGDVVLNLTHTTMSNNKASGGGAVMAAADGAGSTVALNVADSLFQNNSALNTGGGAIWTQQFAGGSVVLNVSDTTFKANKDDNSGGSAVSAESDLGAAVTHFFRRSTFRNNVTGAGGALSAYATGSTVNVEIDNCVFIGNKATGGEGGAVAVASNFIGGVAGHLDAKIRHATIIGNTASQGGGLGGRAIATGSTLLVTVTNTILRGNKAPVLGADAAFVEVTGGQTTVSYVNSNLGVVAAGAGVSQSSSGTMNEDPKVNKLTGRLKPTSAMIDRVSCLAAVTDDIDGEPRPTGAHCDVGADEFVG